MITVTEVVEIINITVHDEQEVIHITVDDSDESVNITVNETLESISITVTEEEVHLTLEVSDTGTQGLQGISAYEVAVNNGFIGTEPEWLKSLVKTNIDGGIIY